MSSCLLALERGLDFDRTFLLFGGVLLIGVEPLHLAWLLVAELKGEG